jgi:catechol 2,3-dioxygenase-like lactoylglutathione lyase family enzyme
VKNLHLVVENIESVRKTLQGRGLEISDVNDMGGIEYAYFEDPDGNSWALQQIDSRVMPDRAEI